MKKKRKNKKLPKDKQLRYETEAINQWGKDRVVESTQRWNSYGKDKKELIKEECRSIFQELADNMQLGVESELVRDILIKWHQFLCYFYEPSLEVLRGLGDVYTYSPEFRKFFEDIDPELPDFLQDSINFYVDELEMQWLESQYEVLRE